MISLAPGSRSWQMVRAETGKRQSEGRPGDQRRYQISQSGTLSSPTTVDQTTGIYYFARHLPLTRITPIAEVRSRIARRKGQNRRHYWFQYQGVTCTPRGDATVLVVGADNKVKTRQIVAKPCDRR